MGIEKDCKSKAVLVFFVTKDILPNPIHSILNVPYLEVGISQPRVLQVSFSCVLNMFYFGLVQKYVPHLS